MSAFPPGYPDIRRRLRDRLLNLTPRAFEYFAGDLLEYVGLRNVAVTRHGNDGGIDAHGDLIAESGLVHIRAAVQVKRYRRNVGRPDIDALIGAYGGRYDRGIFITTASYTSQAREWAATSPLLRVDAIDGAQVTALMYQHSLGISDTPPRLDEEYFLEFEAQASGPARLHEQGEHYSAGSDKASAVLPEDDVISLRALSYALRVDMQTVRRGWVETGKLTPDIVRNVGARQVYFFRRDRIDSIRRQFMLAAPPATGVEWRQSFLDFARSRNLTRSYKPVMLKALLKLVNRDGEARLDDLAREFCQYYIQRQNEGLAVEHGAPLLDDPANVSLDAIRQLILKNPLDRLLIQGFLEYSSEDGVVRFAPQLWQELRFYELLDIQRGVEEQLRQYYSRSQFTGGV